MYATIPTRYSNKEFVMSLNRVEPQTASEALEIWKRNRASYNHNPNGEVKLIDVFADANRTEQLAEIEGINLRQLVGDNQLPWKLISDSSEFEVLLEQIIDDENTQRLLDSLDD